MLFSLPSPRSGWSLSQWTLLEIFRMFRENKKSLTEVHHELFSLLAIDDNTIEKIEIAVEIS
ncbi:unnamed protein product [Brassica rapa subsp. trilocularis]